MYSNGSGTGCPGHPEQDAQKGQFTSKGLGERWGPPGRLAQGLRAGGWRSKDQALLPFHMAVLSLPLGERSCMEGPLGALSNKFGDEDCGFDSRALAPSLSLVLPFLPPAELRTPVQNCPSTFKTQESRLQPLLPQTWGSTPQPLFPLTQQFKFPTCLLGTKSPGSLPCSLFGHQRDRTLTSRTCRLRK